MNHSTSAAADPHLQGAGEHCATILADDELRRRIRDTAIGQIGAQGVPLSWQALATTTGLSRDVLVRLIGSPPTSCSGRATITWSSPCASPAANECVATVQHLVGRAHRDRTGRTAVPLASTVPPRCRRRRNSRRNSRRHRSGRMPRSPPASGASQSLWRSRTALQQVPATPATAPPRRCRRPWRPPGTDTADRGHVDGRVTMAGPRRDQEGAFGAERDHDHFCDTAVDEFTSRRRLLDLREEGGRPTHSRNSRRLGFNMNTPELMCANPPAGGVQDQPCAPLPADVGDLLIEIGPNTRRQASTGDDIPPLTLRRPSAHRDNGSVPPASGRVREVQSDTAYPSHTRSRSGSVWCDH